MTSPFLNIPQGSWIASNALAFAIHDRYPVSPGHALVIPRRVIATWFDATPEERTAIFALVDEVKQQLDETMRPDGYNIGINAGEAAGQTVMHLHVHVIPRYRGDVDDPRGGVRHVIPGKGNYLDQREAPLARGGTEDPFLAHLAPLFRCASNIAILAAFAQERGLDVLEEHVLAALGRGARVRIITSDYLNITSVGALRYLFDWMGVAASIESAQETNSELDVRVIEVARLPKGIPSFHPKSWCFAAANFGVAFVGSSNISQPALGAGIEWNLRVDRHRDPHAYRVISDAFEQIWDLAQPLSSNWIDRYAERVRDASTNPLPHGREVEEPLPDPPTPHEIQRAALAALQKSRADGHRRALVVLATGLGKTWLAAFDVYSWAQENGRLPSVLVLAHREELLVQTIKTFRRRFAAHDPSFGWFVGQRSELNGQFVFASVQKLSRPEHLASLAARRFDYVIVDEVHHGTARSYRSIIDRLEPQFLLGLTATPERADGADVAGLFDDHVAYRANLGTGIQAKLLVPFAYFGLKDDTNYQLIPFRNRRFDPTTLEQAINTDARLEKMYQAWHEHPGKRTLVFCCSIRHADHICAFLKQRGIRALAAHSGPSSAARDDAITSLVNGTCDALCTVDLFNEGVDIPAVDRVVMLRPTESPVVFLQQLGRGLRSAQEKEQLIVLDFVGNHRIFLERVGTLLSLVSETTLREFLTDKQAARMAVGCTIDLELEAKDLLQKLLAPQGGSPAEQVYRELRDVRGHRPFAGELYRLGYSIKKLRDTHGGWFDFLASTGDLDENERRVLAKAGDFLRELEITPMSKCYKMVTLEALLEADGLKLGIPIDELARRSYGIMVRSPELLSDLEGVADFPDPHNPNPKRFAAYWRINPIAAWTSGPAKRYFSLDGDRLVSRIPCPADDEETLAAMMRELVDYRLAMYRARQNEHVAGASFSAKVLQNRRDPILKLPTQHGRKEIPRGEMVVRLPDGTPWVFRFQKEFCNVAHPVGSQRNKLPDLLRRWFGLAAGRPGTSFRVRFVRAPDGLWIEPEEMQSAENVVRGNLVTFPSLRVAAGAAKGPIELAPDAERVRLPAKMAGDETFAVRASGDSMNGGKQPIRDGDWLVMRFARGASREEIAGKIALMEVPDATLGTSYVVKRVVRAGKHWLLKSENQDHPSIEAMADMVVIAKLVDIIKPESLGPTAGTLIDDEKLAEAFHLSEPPRTGRFDGHLFLFIDTKGLIVAPDRIRFPGLEPLPGETAFVLTKTTSKHWRYAGVARFMADDGEWACSGFDFAKMQLDMFDGVGGK